MSLRESKRYPYGKEKIKIIIVMLPAVLFFSSGLATWKNGFLEFIQAAQETMQSENEIYSILLYLLSMSIEVSIIAFNILNVYNE